MCNSSRKNPYMMFLHLMQKLKSTFTTFLKPNPHHQKKDNNLVTTLFTFLQDSLPEKLAIYEKNIDEFDAFVDTLQ